MPLIIVNVGNNFTNGKKTAARIFVATVAVWGFLLASRFIVDAIDISLAKTQEEVQAIYNGDGAKNVFALMFGWVPGVILAIFSWVIGRALIFSKAAINKYRAKNA